jgi:hypothetical protein
VAPRPEVTVERPDCHWLLLPEGAPEPHFVRWLTAEFSAC